MALATVGADRELLTLQEAGRDILGGVSPWTVKSIAREANALVKLGRCIRVKRERLVAFIRDAETVSTGREGKRVTR